MYLLLFYVFISMGRAFGASPLNASDFVSNATYEFHAIREVAEFDTRIDRHFSLSYSQLNFPRTNTFDRNWLDRAYIDRDDPKKEILITSGLSLQNIKYQQIYFIDEDFVVHYRHPSLKTVAVLFRGYREKDMYRLARKFHRYYNYKVLKRSLWSQLNRLILPKAFAFTLSGKRPYRDTKKCGDVLAGILEKRMNEPLIEYGQLEKCGSAFMKVRSYREQLDEVYSEVDPEDVWRKTLYDKDFNFAFEALFLQTVGSTKFGDVSEKDQADGMCEALFQTTMSWMKNKKNGARDTSRKIIGNRVTEAAQEVGQDWISKISSNFSKTLRYGTLPLQAAMTAYDGYKSISYAHLIALERKLVRDKEFTRKDFWIELLKLASKPKERYVAGNGDKQKCFARAAMVLENKKIDSKGLVKKPIFVEGQN